MWSSTPPAHSHKWISPRHRTFRHININDLCDYLNVEIGASSAFYYGKVPYYHLNGHFLIIEWWALKRDCLRCEDWWICQRWIVGDFEWRLFFGVRRVCSGRISGPIAGPGPLDFFFFCCSSTLLLLHEPFQYTRVEEENYFWDARASQQVVGSILSPGALKPQSPVWLSKDWIVFWFIVVQATRISSHTTSTSKFES